MSLTVRFNIENYLKDINDIRVCNFFLRCLHMKKIATKNVDYYNDIRSCKREIIHAINNAKISGQDQDKLCKEIETAIAKEIIPLHEFGWVYNDERAAFWLCAYLEYCTYSQMLVDYDLTYLSKRLSGEIQQYHNEYIYLGFHEIPYNHNDRVERIIHFFDTLNDIFYIQDKADIAFCPLPKKHIIANFKNKWGQIYQNPVPVKWLPDQEDAVSWAWNFIKKHFSNYVPMSWEPHYSTYQFVQNTTPFNHANKLLAVRAVFDLWEINNDSKKLLLMNLNKAWNQKKLRETRVDKKALNTYLKIKTKMQLDELAEHYDMRISDTLEKLITQHYRQLFQDK
ncbi:hypothetical protein ABGK91_004390 [Escherichia albertii]|uniref:hypothetical protein n=1 Tax=Escherichia albertii TaxID=208962 RepID=UPI000CF67C0F|nr:hypothetical protein [Escherichia albertii]EFB5188758.1 hypothetical protein [Escherichia albertii]EJI9012634.1 hypothetical protein [Escherichia albertii]MCZ9127460.1 hypothetical protein [Escherichia albertii]MED0156911.1 hypothetical protein [Escherichia coli]